MVHRTVTILNRTGLHARPAAEFVKMAGRFEAEIKITKGDLTVDGKSIMGVMMLAAERGSSVTIEASGADEQEAVDRLATFLETDTEREV